MKNRLDSIRDVTAHACPHGSSWFLVVCGGRSWSLEENMAEMLQCFKSVSS